MANIQARKTKLIFETADSVYERGRQRAIVIDARPGYAVIRLKGTRKGFPIPYAAIYSTAVKMEVESARAEKKRMRKAGMR